MEWEYPMFKDITSLVFLSYYNIYRIYVFTSFMKEKTPSPQLTSDLKQMNQN
jgi:hypothetical protein